jgi:PST family polysaccharide transporter
MTTATAPPAKPPTARRALVWSFVNTAVGKFGTLLISILIARLLGPEEFGTYAVALVALMAVLSVNELGVSLAIVRWEEDPRRIAPTVTTISVVASLVFFAAAYAVTPAFTAAMGDPGATDVVRLMLVCVPLNGLVATSAAVLQREFQQGRRTAADQVNIWLGAALSVALAVAGLGAMSLAIGRVVATVVFSAMLLIFSPLPLRLGWDRAYAGALLRFGLPLAGASVVVFAVGYSDQLVVGAVLGANALGFYLLAFNLASWPVAMLSQPVRAVAPAAFARIQNDPARMDQAFRAAFRVLLVVALPLCAFIAGAAVPIVAVVYGDAWAPAALALQWLALHAALRIAFELAYDFLAVRRRSTTLLIVQTIWVVALVPALVVGASAGGIEGVAVAQLVVAAVVLVGCYAWALARADVRIGALARTALGPVAAGVIAGAAAFWLAQTVRPDLLAAVLGGVIALAVIAGGAAASRAAIRALRPAIRDAEHRA